MSYQTLHIYGANSWHDDVVIAGNIDALLALREAINAALASQDFGFANVECNDGEGYQVQVLWLSAEDADLMTLHYNDKDLTAGSGGPASLTIDPPLIAYGKCRKPNGDAA